MPPPNTILRGVKKLAPGTLMHIDADGTMREEAFWSLNYERGAADEARSFDDWREILLEGLRAAVRRRLSSHHGDRLGCGSVTMSRSGRSNVSFATPRT